MHQVIFAAGCDDSSAVISPLGMIVLETVPFEPILQDQVTARAPMTYLEIVADFFCFYALQKYSKAAQEAFITGLCSARSVNEFARIISMLCKHEGVDQGLYLSWKMKFICSHYLKDESKLKCIDDALSKAVIQLKGSILDEAIMEQNETQILEYSILIDYSHNKYKCSSDIKVMIRRMLVDAIFTSCRNIFVFSTYRSIQANVSRYSSNLLLMAASESEYVWMLIIVQITVDLITKTSKKNTNKCNNKSTEPKISLAIRDPEASGFLTRLKVDLRGEMLMPKRGRMKVLLWRK